LLLLHGWPDSGRCWTKVAPLLADRYRIVVPDLRGFGGSDAPTDLEAYRMPVLLGDIAGLIEWGGGGPAFVVGHDFGGALTWQVATWLGDRVSRAVVLAAPHPLRMRRAGAGSVEQLSRSFYVWLMQSGEAGLRLLASDDFAMLARFAFGSSPGFTSEDLEAWEKKTGITIGSGDVLLLRTGRWEAVRQKGEWDFSQSAAGMHASVAKWLRARDVAVIGCDGISDVVPSNVPHKPNALHELVLVGLGMLILDNLDLDQLTVEAQQRKRWEFLFVGAPLRVPGGTGSPLNPLAVF
jgi:pimeloyl-ACP methyl ester carboxylesterase